MQNGRWLVLVVLLAHAAEARAQVPVNAPGGLMVVPNGIVLHRRMMPLSYPFRDGFYGVMSRPNYLPFVPAIGPYGATVIPTELPLYGAMDSRVNVQIIQPPIIIPARPRQLDLSGVDLDAVGVAGLEAAVPGWKSEIVARKPGAVADKVAAKPQAPAKKIEMAMQAPAKLLPPAPLLAPKEESEQLTDSGVQAFRDGEFGVAALRFRQALALEPGAAHLHFLLGQANFALGKFRDAAASIEEGMKLKKDWATGPFEPRGQLYKGQEADLDFQKKVLADTAAAHPKNADFAFLNAYQHWFDGKRAEAVPLFQTARVLAADPQFIDSFLKASPKP